VGMKRFRHAKCRGWKGMDVALLVALAGNIRTQGGGHADCLDDCAGCGRALGAVGAASAAVKVNVWTGLSGDDKGRFEEMIKAFNGSQKDVEVVPSFYQWDLMHSKLVASVQAGGTPEALLMWSR